jgi:hypothetical protein
MDKKISEYIQKQRSPQKEICLRLREIIFQTFPNIEEKFMWGVPTFGDGKFYIGALRDHVNVGFSIRGMTAKQLALFEGNGKTMRHIKVWSLENLDEKKIVRLLKTARECYGDC